MLTIEIIMSFLKLGNIYKSFGSGDSRVDVLQDISLDVSKGEFVVLLGHSIIVKYTIILFLYVRYNKY